MLLVFICSLVLAVLGLVDASRLSRPAHGLLSQDKTSAINGFFMTLVFLRHAKRYIPEASLTWLDTSYLDTVERLGQLIVVAFLLFSGYGMMESIRRKEGYVDRLVVARIAPFVADMAVALVPYFAIRVARANVPSLNDMLLALVGRKSIGNSDWYVFAMLCLWTFTWVSFRLAGDGPGGPRDPRKSGESSWSLGPGGVWRGIAGVAALTCLYVVVLWLSAPDNTKWFNTVACYPLGMALSQLLAGLGRTPTRRELVAAGAAGALMCASTYVFWGPYAIFYGLRVAGFALAVAAFGLGASRVSLPFAWVGNNLFYFYIYQKAFMIVLAPLAARSSLLFLIVCAACLVAWVPVAAKIHARVRRSLFGAK